MARNSLARRLATSLAAATAFVLASSEAPLADCMQDNELVFAILGGSFKGRWEQSDSTTTWVAILHIESDEWRPDSVFTANGYASEAGLERHFFLARPLAVLSGSLAPEPVLLTNGVLRNLTNATTHQIGEYFIPAVGDTIVQVETRRMKGTLPGTAYVSLCTTVPVKRAYAMGVPLATILDRAGVAKRDSISSGQDH